MGWKKKHATYLEFEQRVGEILGAAGGAVRSNVAESGQLFDFLLTRQDDRGEQQRVAVEVKALTRPMTARDVKAIEAQFRHLLDKGAIDRLLIVSGAGYAPGVGNPTPKRRISLATIDDLKTVIASPSAPKTQKTSAPQSGYSAERRIFALMPFQARFVDVYDAIREIADTLKMAAERADDIQENGQLMEQIYAKIKDATIVIADLTGKNANVFYEVGYSHSVKPKRTVLLTDNAKRVPFDLRTQNLVTYDSIRNLKPKLLKRLKATLSDDS